MTLKEIADSLSKVLDKEAEIYEKLLKISEHKTKVIVENKVAELEALVKEEQNHIAEIAKLEEERESLVQSAAESTGKDSESLNITELAAMLPDNEAAKLRNSSRNISIILESLKNINELNGKLIKNALEYINFSINLLSGSSVSVSNYENTGNIDGQKSRSMFDLKL